MSAAPDGGSPDEPGRAADGDGGPPLRFGLIGAGRWADVHRRALAHEGLPLEAVAVRSESTAERVRADWGVAATTDVGALLERPLDAVIVASPNYLHAAHALAALEAGKHVLVEKPMALTVPDCDRMLEAAAAAGRVLAVGHEMRVFTLFEQVRREVAALGGARHLDLRLWRRPHRSGASGWKTDPAKLGSSILEEPIHYLDLARWLVGEPRTLQAWAVSRPGREGLWEDLDVRLTFEGGATALVSRSLAAFEHHVGCDMTAPRGALRARWDGVADTDEEPSVSLVVADDEGVRYPPVSSRTGHAFDVPRQTRAFVEAVRRRIPPPATGADGRAAVALCLAVERSLRQGSAEVRLGALA